MRRSAHSVYRDRLETLAQDAVLLAALGEPIACTGDAGATPWRRVYGRFHPDADSYALIVLEQSGPPQRLCTIEAFATEPAHDRVDHSVRHPTLGWVTVSSFPRDARLSTLPGVLAAEEWASVVRYRPGKRCTLRVERDERVFYGKVFPDDSGARLHAEALTLWEAREKGELGFDVAEPVAWDPALRVLWQRSVEGRGVLSHVAGSGAPHFVQRLGAAAGTLPRSTLTPTARFDSEVQCERSRSYARELGVRVPHLAGPAAELVEALAAIHRDRPTWPRPIHGAPHVNQWLEVDGGLALVDFDRFSAGDPELDVATFLGELDFEDGLQHGMSAIAAAFIRGYESTAGPLDDVLLWAYRAHKRLAKALRSARALRVDGDVRAARHLGVAIDALTQAGAA